LIFNDNIIKKERLDHVHTDWRELAAFHGKKVQKKSMEKKLKNRTKAFPLFISIPGTATDNSNILLQNRLRFA
jgi:hypothetical protein